MTESTFDRKDPAHVQAARDIIRFLIEKPSSTNGDILRGCRSIVFGFLSNLVEAGVLIETQDSVDPSIRRFSYRWPCIQPENVLGEVSRRIVYHVQNAGHPNSSDIREIVKSVQPETYPVGTVIGEEKIRDIARANPSFFTLATPNTLHLRPAAIILAAIAESVYGPPVINAGAFDTQSALGRRVNVKPTDEKVEEPATEMEDSTLPNPLKAWNRPAPAAQSKNIEFRVTYNDDGTVSVDYTGPGDKLADLMSAALMEL